MEWITLLPPEEKIAAYLANARLANNQAAGVVNAKVGPQSDAAIVRLGTAGELAFAKLFNVYPDLTTHPRRGGVDAAIGPYTIDVKTTTYPNGLLLAVRKKEFFAADVYALILADPPRYKFCGFAGAGDLLHPSRLGPKGFSLEQSALRPDLPLTWRDIPWSGR